MLQEYLVRGLEDGANKRIVIRPLTGGPKKYIYAPIESEGDGEVAERLMAPLSKSGILSKNGIVGSNPTLSAMDVGLNDDPPV